MRGMRWFQANPVRGDNVTLKKIGVVSWLVFEALDPTVGICCASR